MAHSFRDPVVDGMWCYIGVIPNKTCCFSPWGCLIPMVPNGGMGLLNSGTARLACWRSPWFFFPTEANAAAMSSFRGPTPTVFKEHSQGWLSPNERSYLKARRSSSVLDVKPNFDLSIFWHSTDPMFFRMLGFFSSFFARNMWLPSPIDHRLAASSFRYLYPRLWGCLKMGMPWYTHQNSMLIQTLRYTL